MNRRFETSPPQQRQQQYEEADEDANLPPSQLLQLAESHLRLRNFSLCRQYALESQQPNDPNSISNQRHASQLLAVSNILSSPSNYYSILQVDTFSTDITLIRSKFKHLLSILDPIKGKSNLINEAVSLLWKAYGCLSDPVTKTQFDLQIAGQNSGFVEDEEVGRFWTFCPYCFYMYQYARVYEGCCLRCQNEGCRRAFHGVAVNSIPKSDLDKGNYFSCFGYFPLGFSPENGAKFDSWSPIVGMFPVNKRNGGDNNVGSDPDFIDVMDESDESENGQVGGTGGNFGSNVGEDNAGMPQRKRRKSVAWSARKLMGKGRRNNSEGGFGVSGDYGIEDVDEGYGFEVDHGGVSGFESDDMAFFEEGGEIFVEFGPDGGAL